jgi:hypothetical protein
VSKMSICSRSNENRWCIHNLLTPLHISIACHSVNKLRIKARGKSFSETLRIYSYVRPPVTVSYFCLILPRLMSTSIEAKIVELHSRHFIQVLRNRVFRPRWL